LVRFFSAIELPLEDARMKVVGCVGRALWLFLQVEPHLDRVSRYQAIDTTFPVENASIIWKDQPNIAALLLFYEVDRLELRCLWKARDVRCDQPKTSEMSEGPATRETGECVLSSETFERASELFNGFGSRPARNVSLQDVVSLKRIVRAPRLKHQPSIVQGHSASFIHLDEALFSKPSDEAANLTRIQLRVTRKLALGEVRGWVN
jgi:hypothetical protein